MAFSHLPLGQRIPDSLHGVSCSLPTMRAVIGYEEKDPAITSRMTSGYPRFVQHPLLRQVAGHLLKLHGLDGHQLWLTSSIRAARQLTQWLSPAACTVVSRHGMQGVAFPADPDTFARAKTWLQHAGALPSSRAAEDYLIRVGEKSAAEPELALRDDAEGRIRRYLRGAFAPAQDSDILLANSGMNAIWAGYHAISKLQATRGRRLWVQLGWLYLDTIAILRKFSGGPENYHFHGNVFDLEGLRRVFAERGSEIAGMVTEVPTNPLIQTPDLPAVHELCRSAGAFLVVDPTVVSPLNIDVLPHADLVVNSLTKYSANEGDILFGAVIVNPSNPDARSLREAIATELEPIYPRDMHRLAAQIGDTSTVVKTTNANAAAVVRFLESHPRIESVLWTLRAESRANYLNLARSPECIGSVLSFTVKGDFADFYDRLRLPKGPSFGMKTTLICPFIYLAHYDLVVSEEGRKVLRANNLPPDLMRLSVGCEPADEIIAALREALE
ncbi:MAG: PLP-dependent transferase [Opitutaceae bacterium]|nr:PLP-dependent transferase [Opitutaceae bacterium]